MSGFQGTKGPWVVFGADKSKPGIDAMDENGHRCRTVILYGDDDDWCGIVNKGDEQKANALLISKSPEMLEMLEKMVEIIDKIHPEVKPIALLALRMNAKQLIKSATKL